MSGQEQAGPPEPAGVVGSPERAGTGGSTRQRRWRWAVLVGVALVTVVVVGLATLGLGGPGEGGSAPTRTGPAATATVSRQDLVKAVTLAGELGYGRAEPLASTATGTVTWLPEVGATVGRGGVLLRVDEQPVVLFYGFLPMYRPLTVGTEGSDVRQFERNLAALGYQGFTADDEFTDSTAAAVKRWQRDLGLPEGDTVDRERVVYAPNRVRVADRLVRVGGSATGDVLSYTGTTRLVTVGVEPGRAGWARRDVAVTVTLPTGGTVAGKVTAVGAPGSGPPPGGEAPVDPERPGTGAATVEVTIAVADQKALGGLANAPVDVRYVEEERRAALTVPVDALLALAEGGYGLEVVEAGATRIVPVTAGLFADGRVEVTGDGLAEGMTVGVPS